MILMPFGAQLHGAADALLHRTSECDSLFQLLCNVLCYELCVEVRALNFDNVDNDGLAELSFSHCRAELLDLCAALTDDHTGLGAVDVNANLAASRSISILEHLRE
jgi:hypothetical protein